MVSKLSAIGKEVRMRDGKFGGVPGRGTSDSMKGKPFI